MREAEQESVALKSAHRAKHFRTLSAGVCPVSMVVLHRRLFPNCATQRFHLAPVSQLSGSAKRRCSLKSLPLAMRALQSERCEFATIIADSARRWVAESAVLVGISSARKLARGPETAFEELRISPHEEIPKGTQCYLNVAAPRRTLRVLRSDWR